MEKEIKISLDGDMFCVLLGENLQEGVAGFGKTLRDAFIVFDENYKAQLNK